MQHMHAITATHERMGWCESGAGYAAKDRRARANSRIFARAMRNPLGFSSVEFHSTFSREGSVRRA